MELRRHLLELRLERLDPRRRLVLETVDVFLQRELRLGRSLQLTARLREDLARRGKLGGNALEMEREPRDLRAGMLLRAGKLDSAANEVEQRGLARFLGLSLGRGRCS